MIVGIDLGTTNSLVAWVDGQKARLIPNRLGEFLTPSVVSVDAQDGTVYVGRTALAREGLYPFDTASVFKRSMGTAKEYKLGGRTFRPEELSSLILRSLKEDAETYLGQPVEEAVISVPAYFNDQQRRATRQAGQLAGLRVERIVNEPTAAAMAYGICEQGEDGRYLVFDLGGGTLDVSILELFQNIIEVHAIAGDNFLGGEDFTQAMLELFAKKINLDLASLSPADAFRVRRQAEWGKLALSEGLLAVVSCDVNGKTYSTGISRGEYETACRPLLERIRKPVERSLRDAGLSVSEIDDILLVGGASKSPIVRGFCKNFFGRDPRAGVDPDQAIAMGAALAAGIKERKEELREVILTDVCPFSLGVEVSATNGVFREDGHFAPIIERNTVIPVSRTERFYTVHDQQTEVRIVVLQGESRMARDNLQLGELSIPVPPNRAGAESVDITFTYDVNSLLEVEILVNSTGQKHRRIIQNGSRVLTDEEAQERLKKLQYLKIPPREEEPNRLLLFRGEQLYQETHGAVRQEVDRLMTWFEQVLSQQDRRAIEKARKELSEALDRLEEME
ncbi:molecular chaperone HscC [uncultured Gemmiger sp.]|uniref:Hsp70 family protein n=1 Tax=uncultured Gemmiger sp. TaxID=1623490 RepID=UPI0025DC6483|nr:molecular chaperone HscC [uncultured Gemmiger sp.]